MARRRFIYCSRVRATYTHSVLYYLSLARPQPIPRFPRAALPDGIHAM